MEDNHINVYLGGPLGCDPGTRNRPTEVPEKEGVHYFKIRQGPILQPGGEHGGESSGTKPTTEETLWCSNPTIRENSFALPPIIDKDEVWTADAINQVEWRRVRKRQTVCRGIIRTFREVREIERKYYEVRAIAPTQPEPEEAACGTFRV